MKKYYCDICGEEKEVWSDYYEIFGHKDACKKCKKKLRKLDKRAKKELEIVFKTAQKKYLKELSDVCQEKAE